METPSEILLRHVRDKFPDAILDTEDGTEEADYERCIINAMKECYEAGKRYGYALARDVSDLPTAKPILF